MAVLQYLKGAQGSPAAAVAFERALEERMPEGQWPGGDELERLIDPLAANKMCLTPSAYKANYLLFWGGRSSGDAAGHVRAYAELRHFVATSFEAYRTELWSVCWPIFVHLYVELIEKNQPAAATQLLNEYRVDHELLRSADLRNLARLRHPDDLARSDFVREIWQFKFTVRISSYAVVLLTAFLHRRSLLILVCILNQRVNFLVEDCRPAWSGHAVLARGDAAGGAQKKADSSSAAMAVEAERASAATASSAAAAIVPAAAQYSSADRLQHVLEQSTGRPVKWEGSRDQPNGHGGEDAHSPSKLPSVLLCTVLNARDDLTGLGFSPDAEKVVGTFGDSTARVWATAQGDGSVDGAARCLAPERSTALVGHHGPVYAADWSPDSRWLLTAGFDGCVNLWAPPTAEELLRSSSGLGSDGATVTSSTPAPVVQRKYEAQMGPAWDVHWGSNAKYAGRLFATAHRNRCACVWDIDRENPLRYFSRQLKHGTFHRDSVGVVRIAPNACIVATGSDDKSVRLWDIRQKRAALYCVGCLARHHGSVDALAFSRDGMFVASGGADRQILVWDLRSIANPIHVFRGHTDTVWSLDFAQRGESGTILASGGADCTVRLWNVTDTASKPAEGASALQSPELLRTLRTKSTPVLRTAFNDAGGFLLAGGGFSTSP